MKDRCWSVCTVKNQMYFFTCSENLFIYEARVILYEILLSDGCLFAVHLGQDFRRVVMLRNGAVRTKQNLSTACQRIRFLLVSRIFTNFVGITLSVFSLPSADSVDAVKT